MSFLSIFSGLIDGASKIRQGDIDKKAAKLSAQQKELGAQAEINAAAQDEIAQRDASKRFMGRNRAAAGQSGLVGVNQDAIERQSLIDAEMDALNTRYQGQLRGWALREGLSSELQAGKNKQTSAAISGAASFLQGYADYRGGSKRNA